MRPRPALVLVFGAVFVAAAVLAALGYLSLLYSLAALVAEGYYLLQQNSLVNAFQRELLGVRE